MKIKVAARILRGKAHMSREDFAKFVAPPKGPEKLAIILSGEAKQLLAMDRYERRALSRRKIAIQALDEARRLWFPKIQSLAVDLAERSQNIECFQR